MSITRLQGKVAAVLNEQQLVINVGARDGVTEGMQFAVLGAEPIIVRDPDSGEELDKLDPEKTRVEAIEVRDRVTVCETYRSFVVGLQLHRTFMERLSATDDDKGALPEANPNEGYVRIGDRVVQVVESNEAAFATN